MLVASRGQRWIASARITTHLRSCTTSRQVDTRDPARQSKEQSMGNQSKQTTDGPMPDEKLREFCDKHYNQLLPLMAEKVHQEKLQAVQTRLTYEESSQRNSQTKEKLNSLSQNRATRKEDPEKGGNLAQPPHGSECLRAARRKEKRRTLASGIGKYASTQGEIKREWDAADRANRRQPTHTKEFYDLESGHDRGGHWKSKSKKQKPTTDEEDLSQLWLCEETDLFTPRIRNFDVPKITHMPTNVKTYDGSGDPEDHLKIFQTSAKIER
ncbi:hypothetical protein Tco_1256564 [Tanacetum coccineum]